MIRVLAALGLVCALAAPAGAQTVSEPQRPAVALSVEQWQIVVGVLPSVGCQTVEQMIRCQQVIEMLREIREQLGKQVK